MKVRTLVVVGAIVIAAMLVLSAWAWVQIPDGTQIPVHWGPDGKPDGYGPKWLGLLGLPATALFIVGLLAVIPRFEPRRQNLERSATAYVATGLAAVGLMGVLHAVAVMVALGNDVDVATVALISCGAMFVVIGNFLGKTRSNWFFGIRTPWTLSSDRSWTLTHRLGGWLFIGTGLAVIVATALLGPEISLWIMLGLLLTGVVGLFAYSYVAWRDDPARRENGAIT